MHSPMNRLVEQLLESYTTCGEIKHINGSHLPSKTVVSGLTLDLLHLIFPGFIAEYQVPARDLPLDTALRLSNLQQRLTAEIAKTIKLASNCAATTAKATEQAEEMTYAFLERLPSVRNVIRTDVEAAYQGDPAAPDRIEIILAYPGIEAVAVFRLAHELHELGVTILPRMMTEWAHSRTGIDLHPGAQIGNHFFIDHGTGVVIGGTSIIGNRVRLYQGVGLVARSLAKNVERDDLGHAIGGKRHPSIGDDVTIYAGATIVGKDTMIGDRSIIGGNVWLTHSVPPDSVVTIESENVSIRSRVKTTYDWVI